MLGITESPPGRKEGSPGLGHTHLSGQVLPGCDLSLLEVTDVVWEMMRPPALSWPCPANPRVCVPVLLGGAASAQWELWSRAGIDSQLSLPWPKGQNIHILFLISTLWNVCIDVAEGSECYKHSLTDFRGWNSIQLSPWCPVLCKPSVQGSASTWGLCKCCC